MECLPVPEIPDEDPWTYEIKLDGYRLEVIRKTGAVTLYSRRENVLNRQFPYVAEALEYLPNGTVLDGEAGKALRELLRLRPDAASTIRRDAACRWLFRRPRKT